MHELKYLLDGKPVSARDLIKAAERFNEDFAKDGFKTTSEAATILRQNGSRVEDNPEYEQE